MTCAVLSIVVAALSATVPFVLWRVFKQEQRIERIEVKFEAHDEVLDQLCRAAGLGDAKQVMDSSGRLMP